MGDQVNDMDVSKLSPEQKRKLLAKLLAEKVKRSKQFPMSHGQQGLWHAFRRDPNSTAFNVFLPTRLRSRLQPDALQTALNEIAARHSSLRASFSDTTGQPLQTIHDRMPPEFAVENLPGASDEVISAAIGKQAAVPFDLERGPLLRMTVYRIAEDDWVVFAQAHHIVVDFWSLVLILGELRELYPRLVDAIPLQLPEPQNNYAKFVQRQAALLDSPEGQQQREYWMRQVTNGDSALELPTDFVRPAKFTGRAAVASLELPSGTGRHLIELATKLRVTPVAVVHAAIAALLSGYSGQEAFFLGSPFSGRSQRDYESTVGFFVNVLPILLDVRGNPSFAEQTRRCAKTLIDALQNEDYPISKIVAESDVIRDSSRSPLFQVSCTFEKSQVKQESGRASFLFPGEKQSWDFGGMRQESFYFEHPTCHYDVEFIFELSGDDLKGMVCYCKDLFSRQSMDCFTRVFAQVLMAGLNRPNNTVSRLLNDACGAPQDSHKNRQEALPAVRAEALESATQHHVAQYHVASKILQHAQENGSHAAFIADDEATSYGAFASSAARLARALRDAGTQSGDRVPVYCKSGRNAFAAILGVQLSGAIPIPIDANQPSVSWEELSEDTGAKRCVCDAPGTWAAPSVPQIDIRTLSDRHSTEQANDSQLAETQDFEVGDMTSAAYVVYTSGSTGRPKGVEVPHSAIGNTLAWRAKAVPLFQSDRVLMLLSHQFDAALGVAWTTFTQGATLVWPSEQVVRDPALLVDFVREQKITVLPAVPSLLKVFVEHPRFSECKSLRYIWTGGESMPAELPGQIRASQTATQFWNFYGPTEAAVEATAIELLDHDTSKPIPIGPPIDGCEILILGKDRFPVPTTMPGEIAIGGRGLANGYVGAPELTAERFVPHPVSPDRRVYLTGDRGRRLTGGAIEFLGRNDHQVKLRGYRLELSEIDAAAAESSLVSRCAAKVVEGSAGASILALFVQFVDATDEEAALGRLRGELSERLPAFKRPDVMIPQDSMPMLTSGKVDRKQLPDTIDAASLKRQIIDPMGAAEEFLLAAWCEVIGQSPISVDENFFAAGGTSLQAAMLTTQLTKQLGVRVPAALIFDLATIRSMTGSLYGLHRELMEDRFGPEISGAGIEHGVASLITPLRTTGQRPPIFFVHPPGGIVICYQDLMKHLGDEQPVYGIRSRGLHGDEELPTSIESMAAEYVEAIRTIQPEGPYVIGGWSLGGLIAYEMASQCIATGQEVDRIVLIDTTIPEQSTDLVPAQERVNVGLEYGIEMTLEQLGDLSPEEQLPLLFEHAKKLGVLEEESPPEVIAQTLEDLQGLFHRHVELSTIYKLSPLECDILLFRPSETPVKVDQSDRPTLNDRGWGYLVPNVDVEFVPGHHHSMVQADNARHMAAILKRYLPSFTNACQTQS